ncbi:hypothetical protein FA13DRAFT_1744176 [Coprinellus micaceus]|uniref:Uncharacterized protein n=1 Tax=Coprinellus micaceus TaxID=71717 RepID=A0A4Y7SDT4_COPMI|nr:hypothetical protein FA13DRAFT_1744176 [Coprinellus micaceus]
MTRQSIRPEGPSSAIHYSSSSRSASPSPPPSPPLSPSEGPTQDKPPPLPSSQTDNANPDESPHEATARRLPIRPWTEKDEAHRLSLHHLTYSDARFNPPPPSLWKRLASARLGMWKGKKALGRRVWAENAALRLAKENAVPNAQAKLGGQKTRPTAVPTFAQAAVPARDEI